MKKITMYTKEVRDEEIFNPMHLFEPLPSTVSVLHTDHSINIQNTEQNLCSIKTTQHEMLFQQELLSPKSNQQFELEYELNRQIDRDSTNHKQMGNKRNSVFHRFQNSGDLNCSQMMKKRRKWEELKDVLANHKINLLKDIFIQKIKRNNPFSTPVQFEIDQYKKQSFLDESGIELSELLDHIFSVILITEMVLTLFVYTLSLVFDEVSNSMTLFIIQIISLAVSLLEMTISFIHQKTVSGRKVKTLRSIIEYYAQKNLITDSINIVALILSMSTKMAVFNYFRLIIISKFPQILERLQKLEIYIIQNYYNEQYWSLIKTFFFNFCFAHILAILLLAMTRLNEKTNWMIVKGLDNSPWFEKYVWSYYWGTNIMLTVGFGDIVATTYQEAVCLIFIETFSCLVLAYNINCVGSLISNIRAQDIEKSKNFKIFKKLIIKNSLPEDLSWRINNYIEESINIKKKFSLEEQKNFIDRLPNGFKKQVLKQSNKNIFDKITFFRGLLQKTLFSLAEKIEMCIYHPEQIIQPLEDSYNLFILKSGQIGYVCKKQESNLNNKVIDMKKINNSENPFLINLHFITKKRLNYEVKSLVYSILYYLDYDKLINILMESPMDYELYSYLRDKNKNILDEFQVFPCEFCKTKHTKFSCPKLHFLPMCQHVVNKYLRSYKIGKNNRSKDMIMRRRFQNGIGNFLYLQEYHQKQISAINKETETYEARRKVNSGHFAERMKKQRRHAQNISDQAFRLIQQNFMDHTTEVIRQQLVKLMGAQMFEDEVWNLGLDKMKNYKGYFVQDNSSNLKEKFSFIRRIGINKYKTISQYLQQKYLNTRNFQTMSIPSELKTRLMSQLTLKEATIKDYY